MAFMQKQVERFEAWMVETSCGTECVPSDLVGLNTSNLRNYVEGTLPDDDDEIVAELVNGWFHRLSAPGYMDCTEWSGPYESEAAAMEALDEMYPDDEEARVARW